MSTQQSNPYEIRELFHFIANYPTMTKPDRPGGKPQPQPMHGPLKLSDFKFVTPVAKSFNANIVRIWGLLMMWTYVTQLSITGTKAACLAARKTNIYKHIVYWDEADPEGLTPSQIDRARKSYPEIFSGLMQWARRNDQKASAEAVQSCADFLNVGTGPIHDGFTSLLSAAVISAATTFEVLQGDLWEYAVNRRLTLVYTALVAKADAPDEDDEKTFQFPLTKLKDPRFNPRNQMGTLLRRFQYSKWDFQRRDKAQK